MCHMAAVSAASVEPVAAAGKLDSVKDLQERAAGNLENSRERNINEGNITNLEYLSTFQK